MSNKLQIITDVFEYFMKKKFKRKLRMFEFRVFYDDESGNLDFFFEKSKFYHKTINQHFYVKLIFN